MNRLLNLLLTFFLLSSLFSGMFISVIADNSNWIIDGDTVYIDDENAYLSATPHTIMQDTWVTFQLRSKGYEGDIDAVWLFNTTNCKPTKPVYYKIGDGNWTELTKEFTVQTVDFENMTKAYRLENINIQKDVDYYLKCFVDIKFNTSGKYWWGVKPSHLGWDKGYYLDPWWHSSYLKRNLITIDNAYIDATLTNFPVLVNISATISANCDGGNSIRFLNTDNTTEYYYEIEGTWDGSSYNFVWVNITSIAHDSVTKFYLYYNNTDATDNQNPTNVWDSNYLFVSHMNGTGTVLHDSTSNANDGTKDATTEPIQSIGIIGYCQDFERSNTEKIVLTDRIVGLSSMTISAWTNAETQVYSNIMASSSGGVGTGDIPFRFRMATDPYPLNFNVYDDVGAGSFSIQGGTVTTTGWQYYVGTWDGDWAWVYEDASIVRPTDVADITMSADADAKTVIGSWYNGGYGDYWDGEIDELRVSNIARSHAWVSACYNSTKQTAGFLTWGGAEDYVEILHTIVNASTGIELTNATLNAFINGTGAGDGTYSYGFWIGRTNPVTEANADRNMTTDATIGITGDGNFSHGDTNLSRGLHYFVKSWVRNATYFISSYNQNDFYTKCDAPSDFTATLSGCNVDLAWTKGSGATNTVVIRKADTYPISPTDGTEVYNNTDTSYSDITASGSHQYYGVWSWAGDKFSDENVTANVVVSPCPPTSVTGSILANSSLKINWTKGMGADTTMVRKKIGSYPSTITDGTQLYNGTGTSVIETDFPQEWYFRLWSYANQTYSTSVNLEFGALVINSYDEETNANLTFDVFISNQEGTQTYSDTNCTNTHIINLNELPTGEQTSIQIEASESYNDKSETFTNFPSTQNATITYIQLEREPIDKTSTNVTCYDTASGNKSYPVFILNEDIITIYPDMADKFDRVTVNYTYEEYGTRFYYLDIYPNNIYTLNAYLPSTALKELYFFRVVDIFDQSVSNTKVTVKRFINATQQFESITILYTDANGRCSIYLLPGNYKVIINKTGYQEEISDYIPDTTEVTFRLLFEEVPLEPEETLWDGITWSIEPTGFQHTSNITLYFNISSSDNKLEWFRASVYYYNSSNLTWVLLYSENVSNPSGGSISYTTPNITGKYSFVCTFKKENFSAYTFGAEDGCRVYIIFWKIFTEAIEDIPAFAWLIITIVLMIAGTGMVAKFGGGDLSGIIGLAIMGGMFALRPELSFSGVSVWFIFLATAIAYLVVMFLLRGRI